VSDLCETVCLVENNNDNTGTKRCESPMTEDVNTPNVATTVISIQHQIPEKSSEPQQQQQQQQGRWHQQGTA